MMRSKAVLYSRALVVSLFLCLVFSCFPAYSSGYSGASAWAVPELDKAQEYGLITDGISGNLSGIVSREEFAEITVKLYEAYSGKASGTGSVSFSDTTNPEILKAASLGLVNGIGGGMFGPDRNITREQMA
ncbi:MAG: S-layer homology domain-containing protein, partial [Clostridiales bacterium]|nr:S-layer homology domain-containing protein [Clostridiales bacterium]